MKVILILIMLLVPSVAISEWNVEKKVAVFHEEIVKAIQDQGFSGPIAREMARYGQLRVCHEDGAQRAPDISYNGMGIGEPNKSVVKGLFMLDCKMTTTATDDGVGSYGFKGEKAHVLSCVAVALWFDYMINSDRYRVCSLQERKIWNESRHCSHMIAIDHPDPLYQIRFEELRNKRDEILRRVNAAYGPQGAAIASQKRKLWP